MRDTIEFGPSVVEFVRQDPHGSIPVPPKYFNGRVGLGVVTHSGGSGSVQDFGEQAQDVGHKFRAASE